MILAPDQESDFQPFGGSGFGSSKKRNRNTSIFDLFFILQLEITLPISGVPRGGGERGAGHLRGARQAPLPIARPRHGQGDPRLRASPLRLAHPRDCRQDRRFGLGR